MLRALQKIHRSISIPSFRTFQSRFSFLAKQHRFFSTERISVPENPIENLPVTQHVPPIRHFSKPHRGGSSESDSGEDIQLSSIIKVFCSVSSPNYSLPWQNKPIREITGSAFVLSGRRILTNAHVVADHKFVMLRKHGSPHKYQAKVVGVGHDCDLALLQVDDPSFYEGVEELQLGGIPHLEEEVTVIGYPTGGDNISVTRGVVSRVEPQQYAHGATTLLAIQIDAAINPGNSGGPAIQNKKVVGVAFQNLTGAENIGFIIPVPIIEHFLRDVENSPEYRGFCSLGLHCQAMENPSLRAFFQMKPDQSGVLVNKVYLNSACRGLVHANDVVLAVDGHDVGNDGSVTFRNRERIVFDWLVSKKFAGDKVRLKLLRNGQTVEVDVQLAPAPALVAVHQYDKMPSYYIFAGLVFVPLTQPFLHEWGEDWYNDSPRKLTFQAMFGEVTEPDQQVVVLSHVLIDSVNIGYQDMANHQVVAVNSIKVKNLRHVRQVVEEAIANQDSAVRFELEDRRVIVIDLKQAQEATSRILANHRIQHSRSPDI